VLLSPLLPHVSGAYPLAIVGNRNGHSRPLGDRHVATRTFRPGNTSPKRNPPDDLAIHGVGTKAAIDSGSVG